MAGRPAGEILAEGRSRDASVRRRPGRGSLARRAAALLDRASRRAVRAGRRLSCVPAVQLAARAAYLGKTVLYGVVGALALQAALGLRGGRTIDVKEALAVVGAGAAGRATTALVAVAIATLGCWFVLDGLTNAQRTRRGPLQAISRVGQGIGGLGYVALGGIGVRLALGEGIGPSGDEIARAFAARVLTQPTGPLAMGVVGLAAMVIGVRQARLGVTHACLDSLDLDRFSRRFRQRLGAVAALGFGAQGALFALVGAFLIQAAFDRQPGEATGTGGALHALATKSHGATLLLAAALGLLAYALYAGLEGALKRMPPPSRTYGQSPAR
jgi:hypothetical protein